MNNRAHFIAIASFGDVEGLDKRSNMADNEGIACSTGHHADRSHPCLGETIGWKSTIADAKHVGESLEQSPRVLLKPIGILANHQRGSWLNAFFPS